MSIRWGVNPLGDRSLTPRTRGTPTWPFTTWRSPAQSIATTASRPFFLYTESLALPVWA